MSISPRGAAMPSLACSRSASHAPPVYMPIIAVLGPTMGFNGFNKSAQRRSASGSFVIEKLLEYQLRRDRVDGFSLDSAQPALGLDRAEALVDTLDRNAESAVELPREALDAPRERVLARLAHRQPDNEARRLPLRDQLFDLREARNGRQGMRRAQLGLADRDTNAL